jgi:lipopolysaccharide transport system ATP-binding protein
MEDIIEIQNISKRYNITHQRGRYIALRDVLASMIAHPFKFARNKAKELIGKEKKEEFWALKDINLKVKRGEVIGIIGRNGAGKSTLLKILSRITPPTEGRAILRGTVSSLLEIGTGFHPELTGRENIYLNGSILGMTRKEINQKFDEIVEFSGIEKFLDTPVKKYSSGMDVRLAFSIAAHLEPDILLVDEVLAVGDAEFQRKSLGKMEEVTGKQERTILFVSHNMGAIKTLCDRTILLNEGKIEKIGDTNKVVNHYIDTFAHDSFETSIKNAKRKGSGWLKITNAFLGDSKGNKVTSFKSGQDAEIFLIYDYDDRFAKDFDLSLSITSLDNQNRIALISTKILQKKLKVSKDRIIKILIKKLPLNVGRYQVDTGVNSSGELVDWVKKAFTFNVVGGGDFYETGKLPPEDEGNLLLDYEFN